VAAARGDATPELFPEVAEPPFFSTPHPDRTTPVPAAATDSNVRRDTNTEFTIGIPTASSSIDDRDIREASDDSLFRIKIFTCRHINRDTAPTDIRPHNREGLGCLRLKIVHKAIR